MYLKTVKVIFRQLMACIQDIFTGLSITAKKNKKALLNRAYFNGLQN
jgi:hypothetical protein